MNGEKTGTESPAGAVLRVSPGGASVILSSAGLFFTGFLRGELAALLWGGGLFIISTISLILIASAFLLNRRRNGGPEPEEALLFQTKVVFAGSTLREEARFPRGMRFVPGVVLEYRWEARFRNRRLSLTVSSGAGSSGRVLSLTPGQRGAFLTRGVLVIRDFPGLFRLELPLPGVSRFTVYPLPPDEQERQFFSSLGGDETPRLRSRERNRELFDIRKYNPGDDPRRVHWKLYARSGELFLRQGEPDPPPSGRYQIVLDLSLPEDLPRRKIREPVFEWYLSRTTGLLLSLLSEGRTLQLYIPGLKGPRMISSGEEPELLLLLSGLWYCSGNEFGLSHFPSPREGVYFCSTPLSPDRETLCREIRKERSGGSSPVQILCPALSPPSEGSSVPKFRNWLFLPSRHQAADFQSFPGSAGPAKEVAFRRKWEEGLKNMNSTGGTGSVRFY